GEIRTIYLSIDVIPGTKKSIASLLDITERKRAEDAIHTFSAYNRSLIDASLDPLVTIDDNGRISDVNLATEQATGYSREELIGTDFSDYFTEPEKAREGYLRVFSDGTVRDYPLEIRHKDGHITPVQYNATVFRDQEGNVRGVFAAARDITERKKAEEALRESENRFHVLFEQSPIPYQSLDADGRFLEANDAWLKSLGYTREEAIGHWFGEFLAPEQVELFRQRFPIFKQVGRVNNVEFLMQRKDGSRILASFDGRIGHHPDGSFRQTHCVWRDITEQRHAEEALRISEEKYRNVFDWANDAILLHTLTVEGSPGRFIEVNQVACRMLGYSKEELLSMGPVDIVPLTLHPQLGDIIRQAQTKDSFLIESRVLRKDGTTVPVESSIHFVNYQGKRIWISHIRDITERKQAETELARVNRALRMLTDSNQALVHNTDEALLMNEICRIAVEVGGYRMAWIGFAEQDEAKTVRPVAHAGFESGYIESAHITWADSERGRGPGGTAIRTGQLSMARNISMDPAFAPWRADAILRGYQSVIVLPLTGEGRTFGALAIYAREPDAFNTEEVEILKELAGDLAFGITALRTRVKRDQAEETIRDLNAYNRSLIEASPDPLVTIDDNGRISDVNLATEQATGFSSEELIGTDFSDYFTEPEKAKEGYLRVFTDGTVRDYPLEIRHKDGHITPVQYNATVYRDQDGNVRGVFAAARDVTERNKAEGALKESENTLNAVIRGSPIPQFVIDSSHRVIHWNAALEEHSGINANEIIGTNQQWRAFYTHERPCMADLLVDGAIEKIPRWYEGKYSKSSCIEGAYEATDFFPHMGPSGVWLYFTAAPIRDIDGRVIGAVETLEDITGRKNAEITVQKLLQFQNSALMNANVLLFVIDPQGIVKIWNKAAERITGYKAGEVVGSNTIWRQLYPEKEYRQQITGTILRIIKDNNFLENLETLVLCRNGDKKTISWNTRAITDETAELSGYIAIGIDITERKMAEDALRESDNRYRQLVDNTDTGFVVIDERGIVIEANEPYMRLIGVEKREEIIGQSVIDWTAPEAQDSNAAAVALCARQGFIQDFETIYLHRNGTHIHIIINATMHETPGGKRIVTFCRNITERKKAEEVLRESREQYKQLVENISDIIFMLDLKGTITYISPVVQRLSGYTAPEVIGQHFSRFVHHEDIPRVIDGFRRRVDGVYGANEFRILTKDGSERYVRTTQTPRIKDGVVTGFNYTMTDYTERRKVEVALKESEERYRTIIDTAQEGIWALDRNFHINYINEKMAGMLGYTQNEMLGRSFTEFIPEDELSHANVQVELRRAGVRETYELRFRHRNGDILTMLTSSSTLYGPDRTFSGSFSMFTDITERKRAEEALRQVYKKLNLLASITRHDILNQLLALDGYLELSQDSLGDPQKLSEFIKKAQQAAATIEKQITFTRDYQEMGVNAPGWQNVKAGIAQAQERLPLKDVSISVDSRDLEIFADPLFLKVFYNLFDNALRHGGEQLTSVHITSQESDTSLTIICEDDGVGIPVEDKKKLFRKGFGKHTGLGLFLSREILSITGITITENGIPGKGARFEITVPKGMYRLKGAHE
ncbi:MAG: PAS domain S-box protein, partial [Methanoregula sp.]